MCIVSDKLYRFCCQEARSRPPVTLLNLPPCINESDTEDESDPDNDSDTQSVESDDSDDDSDTQSVESDDDL
jgi:hypothetical protein